MTPTNPRSTARNNISKRRFSNNVPPGLHYLPPLNPKSDEFIELFRSFLSSKDERTNILALSEEDAKLFIEIIDRAFRAERLEPELRQIAFSVLRRLCGKTGHLPESYLLSHKFDLSGLPRASGGFADVRIGVLKGKSVAVKSLRVAEVDDKARIRKRFCKEVVMWKNLSHDNVLNLTGVPDTLEDGRFSMVSEWMSNGNIMEYVRDNASNHLKLLADAAEGLRYLHNANIIHGDLKGANILIANTDPVTACLADFGFMTIVHDPSLSMESSKSHAGGGTTPFMAPELLVPSKFKLDKCTPSKEADMYAVGMVVYQVLTGAPPFGKLSTPEVVFKVLDGGKPVKPANALELGLSDSVWNLLEDCWQTERALRPPVTDVLSRVKEAASVCGILSPVKNIPNRYEDPESRLDKFDGLFANTPFDDEDHIPESYPLSPLTNPPLAVDIPLTMDRRRPSQGSTCTDASISDSLFSKISAAESATTTAETSTDALAWGSTKGGNTDALTDILFGPKSDPPLPVATADPVSRSSTPGSEATARPRLIRGDSSPYRNGRSAGSNGSSRTLLTGVTQPQREQSRPDADPTPFFFVPDAAVIATAQSRDDLTHQLRRPASMVQIDGNGKHKPRHASRFHIRERLGRVFDPILHNTGDAHK